MYRCVCIYIYIYASTYLCMYRYTRTYMDAGIYHGKVCHDLYYTPLE